jgi:hypothetical protein
MFDLSNIIRDFRVELDCFSSSVAFSFRTCKKRSFRVLLYGLQLKNEMKTLLTLLLSLCSLVLVAQTPDYMGWVSQSADYIESNKLDSAAYALQRAMAMEPANEHNPVLLLNLGILQRQMGLLDDAYISFTALPGEQPDARGWCYINVPRCYAIWTVSMRRWRITTPSFATTRKMWRPITVGDCSFWIRATARAPRPISTPRKRLPRMICTRSCASRCSLSWTITGRPPVKFTPTCWKPCRIRTPSFT